MLAEPNWLTFHPVRITAVVLDAPSETPTEEASVGDATSKCSFYMATLAHVMFHRAPYERQGTQQARENHPCQGTSFRVQLVSWARTQGRAGRRRADLRLWTATVLWLGHWNIGQIRILSVFLPLLVKSAREKHYLYRELRVKWRRMGGNQVLFGGHS